MDAGEPELALRAFVRAAARDGQSADVLTGLGSANLALGRMGQAEPLLRAAIEADPDNVPAWNNLGILLIETGRAAEAARVFRQAFALDAGATDAIRENLRRALALVEETGYPVDNNTNQPVDLRRQGQGAYVLISAA